MMLVIGLDDMLTYFEMMNAGAIAKTNGAEKLMNVV